MLPLHAAYSGALQLKGVDRHPPSPPHFPHCVSSLPPPTPFLLLLLPGHFPPLPPPPPPPNQRIPRVCGIVRWKAGVSSPKCRGTKPWCFQNKVRGASGSWKSLLRFVVVLQEEKTGKVRARVCECADARDPFPRRYSPGSGKSKPKRGDPIPRILARKHACASSAINLAQLAWRRVCPVKLICPCLGIDDRRGFFACLLSFLVSNIGLV